MSSEVDSVRYAQIRRSIIAVVRKFTFSLLDLIALTILVPLVLSLFINAVPRSREASRNVSCKNNIRQLVLAAQNFESTQGRFPGYRSPMSIGGKTRHIGWTVELLIELEQAALHEEWCDPAVSNPEAPFLGILHCPAKGKPDRTKDVSSYVINVGFIPGNFGEYRLPSPWDDPRGPVGAAFPETAWALSMNSAYTLATDRSVGAKHGLDWDVCLSDILDGASHTLIFSENLQARRWSALTRRPLRDVDVPARIESGFGWILEGGSKDGEQSPWRPSKEGRGLPGALPSSRHGVGVNVGFAGGQVVWLGVEVDDDAYRRMLAPSDGGADLPGPLNPQRW